MATFWQAKLWGLLHDPALKALHNNTGRGGEGCWQSLKIMEGWKSPKDTRSRINDADLIASASDRAAVGSLNQSVNYGETGLEISHLLSGAKIPAWQLNPAQHQALLDCQGTNRANYLQTRENSLLPDWLKLEENQYSKVFWWLWRCFPEAVCQAFEDESLLLMPAETRLPDSSIWNHASITAALAGALAGYDGSLKSHPYLATFSFTPIQELIKASRKMRDFWAGSWILHYLSARICWRLACIYGPDSFLYPSLYAQPLIDHWLLQEWPEFGEGIGKITNPDPRKLLTAGFPNVLVLVLPQDRVDAAMQTARQVLKEEWRSLGQQVLQYLQGENPNAPIWMKGLTPDAKSWASWLDAQWQTYWSAVPIGSLGEKLKDTGILRENKGYDRQWVDAQNQAYQLTHKQALFLEAELNFLQHTFGCKKPGINVGSWWAGIFDQTRLSMTAVKNARTWQIPTAYGVRSTISGIGPAVHPDPEQGWIKEGETKRLWKRRVGLFDGREQLNATETVKRGLHKILPSVLGLDDEAIAASYPDLTAGVAGYLKVHANSDEKHLAHFQAASQAIFDRFPWSEEVIKEMRNKWGIPWIDQDHKPKKYHPRLLNPGWLIEDAELPELQDSEQDLAQEKDPNIAEQLRRDIQNQKASCRGELEETLSRFYPGNNPADWYVIAAGDGDGMSQWLKGKPMKTYDQYLPKALREIESSKEDKESTQALFQAFVTQTPKRMGPSTHSGLSRALLDFSNQLVPYLTEQRYAGRLIYSGGDDVLAYSNLWEWDNWLWDIRQCFRGDKDPHQEFDNAGDYWRWSSDKAQAAIAKRPLFTMGQKATISFGIVIAHHSVPLAIALENLWEAEEEAKSHFCDAAQPKKKDAVQVRVLYGNGNILKTTAKFDAFDQWRSLLTAFPDIEPSLFEQAAQVWAQHPVPAPEAITAWIQAFCDRRDIFKAEAPDANPEATIRDQFQLALLNCFTSLWESTTAAERDATIQSWLKLAAFVLRTRNIQLGGGH